MKTLIATVGLPRSGKTTWAKEQGLPIVSPDAIRLTLHGPSLFMPPAELMVWTIAKYMVRALFLAGHDTVILDATNTTRKRRDEWQPTRDKIWDETRFKVIDTSEAVCVNRAIESDFPTNVIRKMSLFSQPLQPDELLV